MVRKYGVVSVSVLSLVLAGFVGHADALAQVMTNNSLSNSGSVSADQLQQQFNKLQDEINELNVQQKVNKNSGWYLKGNSDLPIPVLTSNNGRTYVKIFGRFQEDGVVASAPGQHSGGQKLSLAARRVRLGLEGQIDEHFIWKFQYDFLGSTSAGGVKDAFVGYHDKTGGRADVYLIGSQFVPFGAHTPSNYTTFLESPLDTSAFRVARYVAATGLNYTKHYEAWYGVSNGKNIGGTSGPLGGSATFTASGVLGYTPINTPGHVVRIGNSFLYDEFSNAGSSFSTSPDVHEYTKLVSTPSLGDLRSGYIYSPNLILQDEAASLRANYYMTGSISHSAVGKVAAITASQAQFSGWSVQANYMLTGEVRPYDPASGGFLGVKPRRPVTDGGFGAFQVGAQLDSVDFNDNKHNVHGGRETNVAFAFNWYPTSYTRVMLDYVKVLTVDGGANNGKSPDIVAGRLQFVF